MATKYYVNTLGAAQMITSDGVFIHFIKGVVATDDAGVQEYLDKEIASKRCPYLAAINEAKYSEAMGVPAKLAVTK